MLSYSLWLCTSDTVSHLFILAKGCSYTGRKLITPHVRMRSRGYVIGHGVWYIRLITRVSVRYMARYFMNRRRVPYLTADKCNKGLFLEAHPLVH